MSWQTDWEGIPAKSRETFACTEIHTYCQRAACTWQMRPRVKVKIMVLKGPCKLDSVSDEWGTCHSDETKSHVDSFSHGVLSLLKPRRLIPTATGLLDTRHIQICNRSSRPFVLGLSSLTWTFLVSIMRDLSPMRSQLSQNLEDRPPVCWNR